eukprot:symbB.v1.2.031588.t1/scaffold3684.1/size52080/2
MGWAFTHKSCIGLMPGVGLALPWAMPQLLDVACEPVEAMSDEVDPEVQARWDQDLHAIEESIRLMLGNRLQEAEDLLAASSENVAKRDFRFDAGDHDMRGCFTFVSALMSLINGLASLENNQLDTVLQRVQRADEELQLDGDWPGRTVLRGLCNLVAGVVEIMQGMPSKGVWHVLRSWFWLRNLESEALAFEGHERGCVRSTALLALGVFNLFVSMLPPTAMKAAGWATGFHGGRDVALSQLRSCWEEGGIQAPFAGMVLIGFCVDISSFLGELRAERDDRQKHAKEILDWANKQYPGAFFFQGLEAGYLAALSKPDAVLTAMEPEQQRLTRSASVPTGSVVLPIEKGVTDIPPMSTLARSQTVQIPGVDKLLGKSPVASKGVLLRTASGYEVALVAPEHLRELQCSVCHDLIQGAVHAPCGHSFCQVHLQGEAGSANELEIQAQRLRELTERGFSLERAREALAAVGDGSIEEAAETCARIAGLEGRAVRVRREVEHPKFEWGAVSHESVGVVVKEEDTQAWVSFAEQASWHCQKDELTIDPVADMVRPNVRVRVRAGVTPKRGWGLLQVDGVATVVAINGCQVRLLIKEGVWSGFINELEAVDESIEPIQDAILRIINGKASEETLAQLHAILKQLAECPDASEYRLLLRSRDFSGFINSFGSFAMLRAVGLHVLRYAPDRSVYLFAPAPGVEDASLRAQVALEGLQQQLSLPEPKVPEQQVRYRVVLHMDPEIFQAGVPVDMVYQDQLRSLIIPAIAPPREGWAWPQRGWTGEDAMVAQLRISLPQGQADLCREQDQEQATKVAERLQAAGLQATVEEGTAQEPMREASLETPSSWVGNFARGSRVRFRENARSVLPSSGPSSIDLTSVGVICDQVYQIQEDGTRDLQYYVCLPKALAMPSVSASMLDPAPAAERIQPGVRVRVNPPSGRDPAYSWGRIQSSDVGVVQRVHLDGKVDVFFMSEEKIWNAALQDLDTENLPMTLRPNCPVCDRPFPSGQQLNLDIAMDAQIRRMKKLMAGARHELNCDSKSVVPQLLRSQTHREELKCNICFDLVVSPVTLPCGHSYCKHHIQVWLLENDSCPICRVRVLHYKDREQKSRPALRTAVPLFQASLQDEDGKGGQAVEGFELHVNRMLETQVIRFFQDEVQNRIGEVATEVWDVVERRQEGGLRRLRNFLDQFRAPGALELLKLQKLDGPDAALPNTKLGRKHDEN